MFLITAAHLHYIDQVLAPINKKSWDHWVTSPFLLITLSNPLETEDINCCSFTSGTFAHSWCIQDLYTPTTVHGHRCLILLFRMHHIFSMGDRSGLQAVKHTHSTTTHPCLQRLRLWWYLRNGEKRQRNGA